MTNRSSMAVLALAAGPLSWAAGADTLELDAGPDQAIRLSETATLAGSLTATQAPFATIGWSKAEGPGEVVFVAPHSAVTTATFSVPGEYTLLLGGFDGYVVYDMVRVTVTP